MVVCGVMCVYSNHIHLHCILFNVIVSYVIELYCMVKVVPSARKNAKS